MGTAERNRQSTSPRKPWVGPLLILASGGCLLTLLELLLRAYLPYSVVTIGHIYSSNAEIYGWGFRPFELIRTRNPDTGEIYKSFTNNHGWRDRDRSLENKEQTYRILAIGDSNTFGPIVPAEKTYTRILEDMLREDGFNAEVINMAYGQWGTDQEVEALQREGILYEPHLIILQFSENDLWDNTYYVQGEETIVKPFYYDLDETGRLVRHRNPQWTRDPRSLRDRIRKMITRSEILKRFYGLYLGYRFRSLGGSPWKWQLDPETPSSVSYSYTVDSTKIEHLRAVTESPCSAFLGLLSGLEGRTLSADELTDYIRQSGMLHERETILRIFEDRWFPRWAEDCYWLARPDSNAFEWRLYFALVGRVKELAEQAGADMAVFSDHEMGLYQWQRYWQIISPEREQMEHFLGMTALIRRFAERNGIGFVINRYVHERARNDPHPNLEGNRAMARNTYEYLLKHHHEDLEEHRMR